MPAPQKHPTARRGHGSKYREIDAPAFVPPPLPDRTTMERGRTVAHSRPWHPQAVSNWHLRCSSILAEQEFIDVDIPILVRLLQMETEYWEEIEKGGKSRVTLAVEIRLHEAELCLPLKGRRSLGLVKAQTVESLSKVKAPRLADIESTATEEPTKTGEAVSTELDILYK